MDKTIKIILAILLFLCLADMPYGFYQFVRLLALAGFAALAFMANKEGWQTEMIVYIVLAILFQTMECVGCDSGCWAVGIGVYDKTKPASLNCFRG